MKNHDGKFASFLEQTWNTLCSRRPELEECREPVITTVETLCSSFAAGGKLLLCGNGGSCADAEHISGELLKGFLRKRELSPEARAAFPAGEETLADGLQNGLPALVLHSHTALMTAFANDVDPENIYAQMTYVLGQSSDVLLGISTGGNAENIRRAFIAARARNMTTILMTGSKNGRCRQFADLVIAAPETETFLIQECHLPIYHFICAAVEEYFYGD